MIFLTILQACTNETSTTYYVDGVFGNNANSGTSPGKALKTIEAVNTLNLLKPGENTLVVRTAGKADELDVSTGLIDWEMKPKQTGIPDIVSELIPQPRYITASGRDFHLTKQTVIINCGSDTNDDFGLFLLQQSVEERFELWLKSGKITRVNDFQDAIVVGNADRDPVLMQILQSKGLKASKDIGEQGYQLWVVDEGVIIHANTSTGLFYGLATLKQLVYQSKKGTAVKAVAITDYPRYGLRGFMFDAGRSPHSIAMMKRIIRICSSFKLNFVIFREGDDELNAVRYKTNKLGSKNPEAIGIEEMAKLVAYAAKHHVTVIPEIESLGHAGAKAFCYPHLVNGGRPTQYPGVGSHLRKRVLDIRTPEMYKLLESIYSEWVPILTGDFIHLGLDEVSSVFCTREQQVANLNRICEILDKVNAQNGREVKALVWGDAPETPESWKAKVIRCLWIYGESGGRSIDANDEFLNRFHQDVTRLAASGCTEEVLMAGGSDSYHQPLAKAKYENALPNIYSWCQFGKDRPNFIGILAVQWAGNQQDLWLPDYLTVAEYGWTPDKPAFEFEQCMKRIKESLSKVKDYTNPRPEEVDRSSWDGIWLTEDNKWSEDIMGN